MLFPSTMSGYFVFYTKDYEVKFRNYIDLQFRCSSRLIEGSQVIEEHIISLGNLADMNTLRSSTEENPRSGPEMPSASHHDAITDLLMCKTDKDQIYVASASRDGVIKLWK